MRSDSRLGPTLNFLDVSNPKRNHRSQSGWEGFFPYYAGYSETFARRVLSSAKLPAGATVFDPWNGSGTTTFAAAHLGFAAVGLDLNPAMIAVARARLLASSEADSLKPLCQTVIRGARSTAALGDEPLLSWFEVQTAATIRSLEKSIRSKLVGDLTITTVGPKLDRLSSVAAAFYCALFAVCRDLARPFQTSNPTWLRGARTGEARISASVSEVHARFRAQIASMAHELSCRDSEKRSEFAHTECKLGDSTKVDTVTADFILTSPPYCTRIDYAAATRIELAVLSPLVNVNHVELGRQMIGSTRVPVHTPAVQDRWGDACNAFLKRVHAHPSKASSGYYYKTHLDYFDKLDRSIASIATALRSKGAAILVVQDSHYKDVHNDLPKIVTEIAAAYGLALERREDFFLKRSMAGINPGSRAYRTTTGAVESVLCFRKPSRMEQPNGKRRRAN